VERLWFKSLHARVPLFAEIAAHPAIVNRLRQLLGEDVMLWHGSQNRGSQTRMAMLAQYARPNVRVAIPISWDHPFRRHPSRPPCLMVSGTDRFSINAT
jgi:hypothetical protein